ncbi:Transposable element P transposase [Holothuria leucospilota]|uniref:Transposable element P transposase n=1 Tax=Holothuria leucospilota TaxID=206669 RepID=A0A9Q0YJ16_HOLLE|nr:Transposable element P transposase [Holothuria leucospilota]
MAFHLTALHSLCRLCGTKRKEGSSFFQKETYQKDIQHYLNVNISDDLEEIHPHSICDVCRRKLNRAKSVAKRAKTKNADVPVNITVYSFSPHQEESCKICEGSEEDGNVLVDFCREKGMHSWLSKSGAVVGVLLNDLGGVVLKRIVVSKEGIEAFVLGKKVEMSHKNPRLAISELLKWNICIGNHEFPALAEHFKKEGIKGSAGQTVGMVETLSTGCNLDGKLTIRHVKCHFITQGEEDNSCAVCRFYKVNLFTKMKTFEQERPQKYTKNVLLTKGELIEKVGQLQREKKVMKQRESSLKELVSSIMEKESLLIPSSESETLTKLVSECEKAIESFLPANSHCELLWKQQKKAMQSKSAKGMRWHPAIIKWAIAVHSKSSAAYDLLRDSGFLILPHPSTLYSYTHFTPPSSGLNVDLLRMFHKFWKIGSLQPHEKYVNLLFDEMKIKSDLVFSKSSGKLVGFLNVGDVTQEMEQFEARCTEGKVDSSCVASHVLLFMVRGLTSKLKFPVAYYFTTGAPGYQLYEMTFECISALRLLGLTVLCLTSDGASSNRKLYELISKSAPSLTPEHKAKNIFEVNEMIYFNSDAPHLLKTLRNNFENSNWNRKTRNLVYDGKPIKWTHLLQLQEWDKGSHRHTPGLVLVPKLTYEHLHLTPGLRMKVSLAAQVMSKTVANGLKMMNKPELASTIYFITMVNKFFDCLNVSSTTEWVRKRNDDIKPYSDVNDPRFLWLEEEFLGFLRKWTQESEDKEGLTAKQKQALHLSRATLAGCHLAVKSFTEMAKYLLSMDGVEFILSDKLNQDPIEEFFSKQRGAGGHHDNPTAEQFGHHFLRNIVAGTSARGSRRANVRRGELSKDISDEPLPKRKR